MLCHKNWRVKSKFFCKFLSSPRSSVYGDQFTGSNATLRLVIRYGTLFTDPFIDDLPLTKPVGCERPELTLSKTGTYWASYADYGDRHLSVDFHIDSFFDVYWGMTLDGTDNSGGVTGLSDSGPLGVAVVNTASPDFTLKYEVPAGVDRFHTNIRMTAKDACGNTYAYPEP